jgi:uncharacterized protein YdeI (YjbR/CyaY-like superfamily)
MPPSPTSESPRFFPTAAEFRAWLAQHGSTFSHLIVGFYKVGSGKPSLTWPESVDEALCFGWIDGVRKRIDDVSYLIRFTPRKPQSVWSSVNIARAEALIAEGRMQSVGLKAYERRTERKSSVYSYEQAGVLGFDPVESRLFQQNKEAWAYFERQPPSYRRTMIYWVVSAKQPATRDRRLAKLIESCASGVRLLP